MLIRYLIDFKSIKRRLPKKALVRQDFLQLIQEAVFTINDTKFHGYFHIVISSNLIVISDFGEINVISNQRIKAFFSLHEPGNESLK
jgi:hypothetical protein